jgi:hypothetical protein
VRKAPKRLSTRAFRQGFTLELAVGEPATIRVEVIGRIRHRRRGRRQTTGLTVLAQERRRTRRSGVVRVAVRPRLLARVLLRGTGATVREERLRIVVEDAAGNVRRLNPELEIR